jgi:hypothetical protein
LKAPLKCPGSGLADEIKRGAVVNALFAIVAACLVIIVGRRVLGRKQL